jgi:hypothetical protein
MGQQRLPCMLAEDIWKLQVAYPQGPFPGKKNGSKKFLFFSQNYVVTTIDSPTGGFYHKLA